MSDNPPVQRKRRLPHLRALRLAEIIERMLAGGRTLPFTLEGLELPTRGKAIRLCQETLYAKKLADEELLLAGQPVGFPWKVILGKETPSGFSLAVVLRTGIAARPSADPLVENWLDAMESTLAPASPLGPQADTPIRKPEEDPLAISPLATPASASPSPSADPTRQAITDTYGDIL
jgi:hypothetical protein